jgi:Transposase
LSVKVANDQAEIIEVIAAVRGLAARPVWAVDIIGAPSALMLALLAQAGQSVRYAPERVVAAMSSAYGGEGKTDVKDAYVIARPRAFVATWPSSTTTRTWSATWRC